MTDTANNHRTHTHDAATPLTDTSGQVRCRRIRQVLGDLGLTGVVGTDWVRFDDGRFTFADLDERAADALLRGLEELADNGAAFFSPSRSVVVRRVLDELTETAVPVVYPPAVNPAHIQLPV